MADLLNQSRSLSGPYPYWWNELDTLDPHWKLLPCNGNKTPIDPNTGHPLADWPIRCVISEQFKALPFARIKAVGVVLGPDSGGLMAVDFDAEGYDEQFQLTYGKQLSDLPATVSWTSGKPGRRQCGFLVAEKYWNQLRGKRAWKNENKRTCLELRWIGHQSIVLGDHPETKGYTWCDGCSPRDLPVAEAPEWLLTPLLKQQQEIPRITGYASDDAESEAAREVLKHVLPRDDYDEWLRVGMILKSVDESMLDDWIDWSRGSCNFDEQECIEKWQSFNGAGLTLGSLRYMAQKDSSTQVELGRNVSPEQANKKPAGSLLKWGEIIDRMLIAIRDDDQDLEMELRSTIMSTFRRSDQQVDAALFKQHTKNVAGYKKKVKRDGLDLSRVKACDWLITGFVIRNDLTLIYGNAGSGKTTVALGLANALLQGTGFLDHQINTIPGKVLFIASDSGAQPLISALQDMNMIDREEYREGPGKRFFVWASDPEQDMLAWDVSLANCIYLQSFVVEHEIDLVIIDSAKAVCSGAGIDYGDNNVVTAVLTYLKQVLCATTSVIIINHDGRDKGAAAGAKAWKEIPSIVHQIKRPDEKKHEGARSFREWTCVKNRLGSERQFHYFLSEGTLAVTHATEVFGNCIDEIIRCLKDSDTGELSLQDFGKLLCPAFQKGTIKNTLTNAVNGSSPRLKRVPNKRGFYRLNC